MYSVTPASMKKVEDLKGLSQLKIRKVGGELCEMPRVIGLTRILSLIASPKLFRKVSSTKYAIRRGPTWNVECMSTRDSYIQMAHAIGTIKLTKHLFPTPLYTH